MPKDLLEYWPHIAAVLHLAIGLAAASHVILHKSDVRAAIGWVGFIGVAPFFGSLFYFLFGVNRILRRAQSLRADLPGSKTTIAFQFDATEPLDRMLQPAHLHLKALARLVGDLTNHSLTRGNRITPLHSGDEAYPAMIKAIDRSTQSVALSSYLFDNDRAGRMFLEALARAVARKIEVRVLIDAVGARYSWPSIVRSLRRAAIPVAVFMPTRTPTRFRYSNLRNHRKILVVDGRIGFTGGMNIREDNLHSSAGRGHVQDIHFRVEGPAVAHLQEVFAVDWKFAAGEALLGDVWYPTLEPILTEGGTLARGIAAGPDHDLARLRLGILGALSCARVSVMIVTPYFLPDAAIITSLTVAAMRGVDVDIIVPERGNLKLVQWASVAQMWQVLQHGCRIWQSPLPFDHSKLFVVDRAWCLLGSANWDARSLRLNFEFNVECYDRELAEDLAKVIQAKLHASKPVTLSELDRRPLLIKLRDGTAWLASPYL